MANKGEPYFFWERKKLRQREAAEDSDNKVSEEKKRERERSKVLATKRLRERDKKRGGGVCEWGSGLQLMGNSRSRL